MRSERLSDLFSYRGQTLAPCDRPAKKITRRFQSVRGVATSCTPLYPKVPWFLISPKGQTPRFAIKSGSCAIMPIEMPLA